MSRPHDTSATAFDRLTDLDPATRRALTDAFHVTMRLVYAVDGPRAFESTKRMAAYHEAGHVVTLTMTGQTVEETFIRCDRGCWGGLTVSSEVWRIAPDTDPAADMVQVIVKLAGVQAEQRFAPEDYRSGSSLDEIILAGAICQSIAHKTGRTYADVMREARALTNHLRAECEPEARAIAAALMRERKLRGRKLKELLPRKRLAGMEMASHDPAQR